MPTINFNNIAQIFKTMIELNGRERVMLHLQDREIDDREYKESFSVCQKGIAQEVDLSQNRVSTLLLEMEEEGLVKKRRERVKGVDQKRSVYSLTAEGERKAKRVKESMKDEEIVLKKEGKKQEVEMEDIEDHIGGPKPYLFVANNIDQSVLDLSKMGEESIFVDRYREQERLKKKVVEVKNGGSSTVLVTGYTGVGKTEMVEEIKNDAESRNYRCFEVKAYSDSTRSFFLFKNLISQIYRELEVTEKLDKPLILKSEEFLNRRSEKLEEDQKYFEEVFYEEISRWLKEVSFENPLFIFLDDLQWAKKTTLQLLYHLTENLDDAPILLIGAYRKDEIENTDLEKTIESIRSSDSSMTVDLEPFHRAETREFIFRRLGRNTVPERFIDICHEFTEGNPLFLKATVDELLERGALDSIEGIYSEDERNINLPQEIKKIFEQKLDRLQDVEREVLQLVSCFSDEVSIELLKYLRDEKENVLENILERLIDTNLLVEVEGDLDFSHDMIRSVTYETLSESERKSLHGRIAEGIEERYGPENDRHHARMARHRERSGDLEKAVESFLEAGERAEEVYANDEAIRLYESALEIYERNRINSTGRLEILERLADVKRRKKQFEEALDELEEAEKGTDDNETLVRLKAKIAECIRFKRDYDEAMEKIEQGLEIVSENDPLKRKKVRCDLLKEKGIIYIRKDEYEKSREIFRKMRHVSEKIDSLVSEGEAIHYLGSVVVYKSEFEEAKEHLKKAIDIFKEIDEKDSLSGSYNNLGIVYRNQQEYDRALDCLKKANKIVKDISIRDGSRWTLDNIGSIYSDIGELDKSIEYHEKCLEMEKKIGDKHGIAATLDNIGVVNYKKGKLDEALEYHERSFELKEELENKNGMSLSLYNLGRVYRSKGEFDKALKNLEKSLEFREEMGERQHISYSKLWLGILHLEQGQIDTSKSYLNEALETFRELGTDYGMGMALSFLGKAEALEGSLNKAKIYCEHSRKIGRDFEDLMFEIRINRNLAAVYLKLGIYENARESCRRAIKEASGSGAENELAVSKKVMGRIFWRIGSIERAEDEFEEAFEMLDAVGNKKEKAKVLLSWGRMLSEKDEDGSKKICSGADLLEEVGLQRWCSKADHMPEEVK